MGCLFGGHLHHILEYSILKSPSLIWLSLSLHKVAIFHKVRGTAALFSWDQRVSTLQPHVNTC